MSAKYVYGGTKWTNGTVRVPDNSAEGIAAGAAETAARSLMSTYSAAATERLRDTGTQGHGHTCYTHTSE